MKMQHIGLAFLVLAGCDGGGGGSDGREALDANDAMAPQVMVAGLANKGPFEQGSQVRIHQIGDAGKALHYSTGSIGEFTAHLQSGTAYVAKVTGRYFSEHFGALSDAEMTLAGIFEGVEGARANVNLATHLIHQRVLVLVDDGMDPGEAIRMAEEEFMLALGEVAAMPVHPLRFARLAVMNGLQDDDNEEGNAWLLAVTAMLERAAVMADERSAVGVEGELYELCQQIAADFADDGMIDDALLQELLDARAALDPDRIHQHLMEFSAERRAAAVAAATGLSEEEAGQYQCNAFGDEMLCAMTTTMPGGSMRQAMQQLQQMAGAQQVRVELRRLVANMNRFVDSDGDGIPNADDPDDDNDGIPDEEDDTPYGG